MEQKEQCLQTVSQSVNDRRLSDGGAPPEERDFVSKNHGPNFRKVTYKGYSVSRVLILPYQSQNRVEKAGFS